MNRRVLRDDTNPYGKKVWGVALVNGKVYQGAKVKVYQPGPTKHIKPQ